MESVVRVVGAIARNRPLVRVVLAYAVFAARQNAAWIGMLVYAFAQGGATTAGVVAVVQVGPAALVAPLAAGLADRRAPSRVLAGGYLVQVVGMPATAVVQCAVAVQSGLAAHRRLRTAGAHRDPRRGGARERRRLRRARGRMCGRRGGAGGILVSAGTLDGAGVEVETGAPRTARLKGVAEAVALVPVVWS